MRIDTKCPDDLVGYEKNGHQCEETHQTTECHKTPDTIDVTLLGRNRFGITRILDPEASEFHAGVLNDYL